MKSDYISGKETKQEQSFPGQQRQSAILLRSCVQLDGCISRNVGRSEAGKSLVDVVLLCNTFTDIFPAVRFSNIESAPPFIPLLSLLSCTQIHQRQLSGPYTIFTIPPQNTRMSRITTRCPRVESDWTSSKYFAHLRLLQPPDANRNYLARIIANLRR